MTHLATRTQLARFAPFIHRPNLSLTTTLPRSQTVTLAQFSTKTVPSLLRRAQPPAMDVQPPESGKPSVEGEDFVHVQDLKMESLSESMVRIDEPSDTAAAASLPAPESPGDSGSRPVALPEELSRNVVVLSCESAALGGVCDVYLVGTAHVSEVISSFGLRAVFVFRYITVFIQNKELGFFYVSFYAFISIGIVYVICVIPLKRMIGLVFFSLY